MSSDFVPFFLDRSDYHSFILFRHIRQSLIATQDASIELFCAKAAAKPEDEFHYLGLLWDCAFKAGIASTRAHSESLSSPPVAATSPSSPKILPTPTRDFSALRASTSKPFGSLRRRFRRRLQVSAPVRVALPQTEKISAPLPFPSRSAAVSPQKLSPSPIPLPQPPQIRDHSSPLPSVIPISDSLPNQPPSSISPSTKSSFIRRLRLRPKLPHWIRPPSTSYSP